MAYTDPCLGPVGVGVLDDSGKLTQAARDAFTAQVILLLTSGNESGRGAKISSLLDIPFPPPSGVKLFDPDKFLLNPQDPTADLFWFAPSPFAPLTFDTLRDPDGGYQKQIVSLLYQPLMATMNLNGNAVAPPVLDYTGFLPLKIAIKLTLSDLPKIAAAIPSGPPGLTALLPDMSIGDLGDFIADLGKVISLPSFPSIPPPPSFDFDFIVFPKLFLKLLELPATLLPDLIGKLSAEPLKLLTPSPPDLFNLIVGLVFGPVLAILQEIGLLAILPKLLVATFIVIVQNLVAALAPLVVSQIIGTGLIVKTIGQALGLA